MSDGSKATQDPRIDELKLTLDHAWSWFSLHAGQRLQMVNYFIIASAFITASYASTLAAHKHILAGFIGVAGALISLAFERLERRTRELVRIAEPALSAIEARLTAITGIDCLNFVERIKQPTERAASYGFVIRSLTVTATTAFIAAAIYAFVSHS
jgi:hypothetical protein